MAIEKLNSNISTMTKLNPNFFQKRDNKIDEIINEGIIQESGSNTNGEYIKFSDGTMICVGRLKTRINQMSNIGSLFLADISNTQPFPITFVEVPKIILTCITATDCYVAFPYFCECYKNRVAKIGALRPTNAENVDVTFDYIAFGFWK